MLRFPKGSAPKNVLTGWQATPGAGWDLPGPDKGKVRAALLRDQGHLCAYCQRRILNAEQHMKVEHWLAQSEGEDRLRWSNLLGVCPGDERKETGAATGDRHCDTARGNATLFLHPVEGQGPSPRDFLAYTAEGEMRPSKEKQERRKDVEGDIRSLNLNAKRLRRARVEVYEVLKQRLDKAGWSAGALREEYRAASIQPGVQAVPQCEVVRYHLRRWAKRKNVEL